MKLEALAHELTVCKLRDLSDFKPAAGFFCLARTDAEISLVCETDATPKDTLAREDDWRAFRVRGPLDFALTGVLSALAAPLAEARIGIFAVSTYDTDYILIKKHDFDRALTVLAGEGHEIS